MNFGADDYLTKPVIREDVLAAIQARLARAESARRRLQQAVSEAARFDPDFSSPDPLQSAFRLTPREAEVLLWVAQGKSNADVAIILEMSEKTVKQHLGSVFQKLGVEGRNAATVRALEILNHKRTAR
jgi:DNA-binding NarL/FixJ family response regulator